MAVLLAIRGGRKVAIMMVVSISDILSDQLLIFTGLIGLSAAVFAR
jgi:hypothetical protein